MVTYIDDRVARRCTRVECYRSILANGRFFITESVESNDITVLAPELFSEENIDVDCFRN
jgi:hypothetical protein